MNTQAKLCLLDIGQLVGTKEDIQKKIDEALEKGGFDKTKPILVARGLNINVMVYLQGAFLNVAQPGQPPIMPANPTTMGQTGSSTETPIPLPIQPKAKIDVAED